MPNMKPKPKYREKTAKTTNPVLLGSGKPVKTPKRKSKAGPKKPATPREMAASYRERAQSGRLTAEQRRKVTQRDKDRLMKQRAAVTRRRFKGSM